MNTFTNNLKKIELFIGGLKFAVIIILIFATALGYGTFMESFHGTEYANRLVYKSLPFMGIQFLMFLSILFAALLRLPPKKHLYGFYTIHAGLITLFLGSYVTYNAGVDGTVTLAPNAAVREIETNEDEMRIQFPEQNKEITLGLPFRAKATDLDFQYEGITLKTFLPFAQDKLIWIKSDEARSDQSSARYRIFNDNFGEFITLSLHPLSDFNNTTQLGPLNVHYMPSGLLKCFATNNPEGLIVWNGETSQCFAPESRDIKKKKTINGQEMIEINFDAKKLHFLPQISPLPLNKDLSMDEASSYRIFSKKLFEKSPHLFVFGKAVAFYNKATKLWSSLEANLNSDIVLPWMGFKLKLLEYFEDQYPSMSPEYFKPIQENGQVIQGQMKAVQVEIDGKTFWVKSTEPVAYNRNGKRIIFKMDKKKISLPYELTLNQFKMDTDPGTNTPASFESFVTLFKGNEGSTKHHIFMNNPLKHQNFTFYQASYFQTGEGPFGSVLSVNFDPGRFLKYLGSLMLVLGAIWHYFLRRKHIQKPGT